ncbi:hypothetical protein Nepgr_027238 [Nepenthes gracilis]|uniref:Uncharacterized protein n=1 Tax=Nepenthes gracilis TaxID=150966 RepID=A0AAD3Y2S0_NEPGR|nr:hypothetical protein Nepgr_027238 [Nepenthes gracilis]
MLQSNSCTKQAEEARHCQASRQAQEDWELVRGSPDFKYAVGIGLLEAAIEVCPALTSLLRNPSFLEIQISTFTLSVPLLSCHPPLPVPPAMAGPS